MSLQRVLVTGSSGLIGSEAVRHFSKQGARVHGIDNNMREDFFGPKGNTRWNLEQLRLAAPSFVHHHLDIRDRDGVLSLVRQIRPHVVIHCAAQPSHDKARDIPFVDFEVNAVGTLNLLEATRQLAADAVFIHMSTNKVYGDAPNDLPLVELATRFDYADPADCHGIAESTRIDRCLHSLFGASKAASDLLAQEYGRYFGMNVGVFRGGCLTGPAHSGVALHGFLSYLVHVGLTEQPYSIFGYKGKQVRDQIHSRDVVAAFDAFARQPRPGEVYNIGGGRSNAASVLECIDLIEELAGVKINSRYDQQHRLGDHICYISDLRKLQSHYPEWCITTSLPEIIRELLVAELRYSANLAHAR